MKRSRVLSSSSSSSSSSLMGAPPPKKDIIFDLCGTLINGNDIRPFAAQLLDFVFNDPRVRYVCIWTSSGGWYHQMYRDMIIPVLADSNKQQFKFIWENNKCTRTEEYSCVKDLSKCWEDKSLDMNKSTTIIIDDKPETYFYNPDNTITVKTQYRKRENIDKELLRVMNLLDKWWLNRKDVTIPNESDKSFIDKVPDMILNNIFSYLGDEHWCGDKSLRLLSRTFNEKLKSGRNNQRPNIILEQAKSVEHWRLLQFYSNVRCFQSIEFRLHDITSHDNKFPEFGSLKSGLNTNKLVFSFGVHGYAISRDNEFIAKKIIGLFIMANIDKLNEIEVINNARELFLLLHIISMYIIEEDQKSRIANGSPSKLMKLKINKQFIEYDSKTDRYFFKGGHMCYSCKEYSSYNGRYNQYGNRCEMGDGLCTNWICNKCVIRCHSGCWRCAEHIKSLCFFDFHYRLRELFVDDNSNIAIIDNILSYVDHSGWYGDFSLRLVNRKLNRLMTIDRYRHRPNLCIDLHNSKLEYDSLIMYKDVQSINSVELVIHIDADILLGGPIEYDQNHEIFDLLKRTKKFIIRFMNTTHFPIDNYDCDNKEFKPDYINLIKNNLNRMFFWNISSLESIEVKGPNQRIGINHPTHRFLTHHLANGIILRAQHWTAESCSFNPITIKLNGMTIQYNENKSSKSKWYYDGGYYCFECKEICTPMDISNIYICCTYNNCNKWICPNCAYVCRKTANDENDNICCWLCKEHKKEQCPDDALYEL